MAEYKDIHGTTIRNSAGNLAGAKTGELFYSDWSHNNVYDTVQRPFRTVLQQIQQGIEDEEVLAKGFYEGLVEAMAETANPFIGESIWTEATADIIVRGGRTKEGRQIWNERMSPGDKFSAAVQYAAKELSPGSREQLIRLYKALTNQTVKGTKYEIPDELMGLFGFRKVPLDLEKTLNFRIQEFKRDERAERNLIYRGTI